VIFYYFVCGVQDLTQAFSYARQTLQLS
jgi:hypothetical protein